MKKIWFLFLILTTLTCCSKKEIPKPTTPTVLVTIAPYAAFVERIAGPTVAAETLIPQGVNIHIYEPTPQDVDVRSRAIIWFRIDEPLESKLLKAFKETNPSMIEVNLQEGLTLISSDDALELAPCTSHTHVHGSFDLHTWMSLPNVTKQCTTITAHLSRLFPQHKQMYEKNLKALAAEFEALDTRISQILAPYKNRAILVSHPSFGYFCRDYHLKQLSVECEGKEPRPKDLEQILKMTTQYQVRCVFLQQGFDRRGAVMIAKKMNIPMYSIDPYTRNYLSMMQQLAEDIAK